MSTIHHDNAEAKDFNNVWQGRKTFWQLFQPATNGDVIELREEVRSPGESRATGRKVLLLVLYTEAIIGDPDPPWCGIIAGVKLLARIDGKSVNTNGPTVKP